MTATNNTQAPVRCCWKCGRPIGGAPALRWERGDRSLGTHDVRVAYHGKCAPRR